MRVRRGLLASAARGVVMATIAALVVTMSEPQPALAGPAAPAAKGISATAGANSATDISSARRRRYYRNGGSAAGLAFMGMAIGTIGAIIAQQQRNDYYYNGYGYGPGYYGGGPYYYYGRPRPYYYGPPYYPPY